MSQGAVQEGGRKAELKGGQAIRRALQVLRAVAEAGAAGARLSELAQATSLNVATTHRILQTLATERLVTQDGSNRRYRLDGGYFALADTARGLDIRARLHPLLLEAASLFEDNFYLSVRSGTEVVCVDRVTGSYPVRVVPFDIGARRPLGVGAAGIALLAAEPPDSAAQIMAAHAGRYGEYQLTSATIAKMVEGCRRQGYSYNPGRFIRGVSGLGVPVIRGGAVIAAINATAISPRLAGEARRREIVGFLRTRLSEIEL